MVKNILEIEKSSEEMDSVCGDNVKVKQEVRMGGALIRVCENLDGKFITIDTGMSAIAKISIG